MKRCAIILAAGRGSRMGGLTDNKPKGLLSFDGSSTVERQLTNLKKVGIKNISIVTGYLADQFSAFEVHTIHNPVWMNTNMLFSLAQSFEWANKYDQILVSYADIFFSIDGLTDLMNNNQDISILYDVNWLSLWKNRFDNPLTDAESFKMDENRNLLDIGQKSNVIENIDGQYMGIIAFRKLGWQTFFNFIFKLPKKELMKLDMTTALNLFLNKKEMHISCIPFCGKWGEIDSARDLKLYSQP